MNLLDEIQYDLVNESASLSNTLRKAKILASGLRLPEFRQWVESELNGYKSREGLPEYRHYRPANLGTLSNGYYLAEKVMLPLFNLPDYILEFAQKVYFLDGVGELEILALKDNLRQRWPQELIMLANDKIGSERYGDLIDAYQPIPANVYVGILEQVKNRLLDFIIGLREDNITPEKLKEGGVSIGAARNTFNTYIVGDQNTVATGENITQKTNSVQKGDAKSLLGFLRGLDIDNEDIRELKSAVAAEPNAANGQLGPKVKAWLGGVLSKVATGSLGASINATASLLVKAVNDYYGIIPS